jgi:dTDP-4-dehydrorhamnose reductase
MSDNVPSILVTGSNGQVGRCLQHFESAYPHYRFIFMGREHLPIQDFRLVDQVIESIKPEIIINAAAYTAVDKAEEEMESANLINGYAVGNLASAAKREGARFIHISTDYVFDGKNKEPYTENDAVNPLNTYGKSKLLGEQYAQRENPESIIIRTSWVYSPFGSNFVKTMLRLMSTRDSVSVVDDQTGSPTYAYDLASVLLQISTNQTQWYPGIYHYSNIGNITWYQFAAAIKKAKGYDCELKPITTGEFPTAAQRPYYTVMNCGKIVQQLGVELKPWEPGLMECLTKLEEAT